MRGDHVLADVLGVRARVADAVDSVDAVDRRRAARRTSSSSSFGRSRPNEHTFCPSSVTSGRPRRPAAPPPRRSPRPGATDLAPARGRHDAVGAAAVAAHARSGPTPGTRARACIGRWPVKPSNSKKPCAVSAVARQELGELVHLARPERHVHEREHLEDLAPSAIATSTRRSPITRCGSSALSRLASPRWPVRRLSAFSRIEQVLNRIRSSAGDRAGARPDPLQHLLDP